VDLSAPLITGGGRLRILFTYDVSSVPPGIDPYEVRMFRDGVLVPRCSQGFADPCVRYVRLAGNGDLRVCVFSSQSSSWRGGG
jgi:hypothetical protein